MATTPEQPTSADRLDGGLVKIAEAAKLLSISRSKCYELINQGRLAHVDFGGFKRVPLSAVKALIADNLVGADRGADAPVEQTVAAGR